jgi:hypothetical protein
MKGRISSLGLALVTTCMVALMMSPAQAATCSLSSVAGNWGYTYTGTVFAPSAVPVAAVGRAHLSSDGNLAGTQTHTTAGQTEVEEYYGTFTVNADCTGSMTINVTLNGQLVRTSTLSVVYDTNINHARMIFTSLTLAGGPSLPAVVTLDASRLVPRD